MLFVAATVDAIAEALASPSRPAAPIAVIGSPRVARALADRLGGSIVAVAPSPRALRKATLAVAASAGALPIRDGGLAAAVHVGEGDAPIAELIRAVRDGGAVVLADRAPRTAPSRLALCGGLVEIEQRQAGRVYVTSGRVVELAPPALRDRSPTT